MKNFFKNEKEGLCSKDDLQMLSIRYSKVLMLECFSKNNIKTFLECSID